MSSVFNHFSNSCTSWFFEECLKNVLNNTLMRYRKTRSLDSLNADKIGRNWKIFTWTVLRVSLNGAISLAHQKGVFWEVLAKTAWYTVAICIAKYFMSYTDCKPLKTTTNYDFMFYYIYVLSSQFLCIYVFVCRTVHE